MPQVEERIDKLERALEEFIASVGIEFNKLYMRTEAELRAFKEERQAATLRSELDREALHEEMQAFKEEIHRENREMNRKWGELANRMGTMVEDRVAPSLPRIVQEQFGLEIIDPMVRRKRKLEDGGVREFDGVAIANDYAFVNSTKSTLRSSDVEGLVGMNAINIRNNELLPQWNYAIIPYTYLYPRFQFTFFASPYAEQDTSAAYRVFRYYSPDRSQINIVAITSHP